MCFYVRLCIIVLSWGEIMNTKFCRNCGKQLPQEAVFCPYCMTKLIDVKTGTKIKNNKKKTLIILSIVISTLVIAALCMALIMYYSGDDNVTEKATESMVEPELPESTQAPQNSVDYTSYMGVWCDEGTTADSITLDGGRMVEVISVDDDLVRFTYTKISSAPHNRIAIISNVNTKIIDGIGTFTFDDDGWGNGGTGKIKFLENEIYIETTINSKNESSMWDIGGQVYLTKDEETIFDLRFSESGIGKNFTEVKSIYGEEIKDSETVMNDYVIHHYDGFRVDVDIDSNEVIYIAVDYLQPGFDKSSTCYGQINGNSNYDDVYRVHSEPNVNKLSEGYVVYNVDSYELRFFFDDNLNVIGFSLKTIEQ